MNSKFKKNFKFDNGKPRELGKFLHMCEDLVIVRLSHLDVPYPNAPVLNSSKQVVGKIEEVLGPQNEVYAAIKLDKQTDKYNEDSVFYSYENKFIPKERFLIRSEVEKKKEEGDKKGNDKKREGKRPNNGRQMPRRDDKRKDGRRTYDKRGSDRGQENRKPFKKFKKSN